MSIIQVGLVDTTGKLGLHPVQSVIAGLNIQMMGDVCPIPGPTKAGQGPRAWVHWQIVKHRKKTSSKRLPNQPLLDRCKKHRAIARQRAKFCG